MEAALRPGILRVAVREVGWIWRDRVALLLIVAVPLLAFAILAATFSHAVIRELRVDVVDQDRSPTASRYVQAINAAPGLSVTGRSTDLNGAMHAVRSGEALAAVYIPPNLERDILGGRRPQIAIFYNKQYFTPGNIASSALQSAISATTAALPASSATGHAFAPGPLVVEEYVLTNPAINYVQFLLRAILPMVLHVVIAISGGYAVGSEFRSRGVREWMEAAGGSSLTALVGKLLPYFGVFIVMMVADVCIIDGFNQIPFRGNSIMMGAAACILIVGYLSLGALFQLLVKNLPTGLSLTAIVCSPAFGFVGVGFPVLAMETFAQVWGSFLPLRWYMQILFDQAARGVPVADSVHPFALLGALAAGYFALAWLRLRSVSRHPEPKPVTPAGADVAQRRGLAGAFAAEYARVLGDRGVFSLIVLGPILYGVLYPQPYLGQLARAIPIAVVDSDGSNLSRTITQTLNADEAIRVAVRASTLAEAQAALARREVFGILMIPAGTEREALKGNAARLAAYVDSAYFLLYNRTLQGILEAAGVVTAELLSHGARPGGSLYQAALSKSSSVETLNQPLFNPTGGYASYVVPAAFVLIVQQTVLMGSATLGGVAFERGQLRARRRRGAASAVLGQGLAHFLLALPGLALYLIVLPRFYGFSTLGRIVDLFLLAAPFILSVSFLGQFVGSWFKRRETAVLLMIAVSLPLFFLVGVAWPVEAIPKIVRVASYVFPSTSAIDGLVRVNQMGATLSDVAADWTRLWILTAVFATLAVLAARISGARRTADAR